MKLEKITFSAVEAETRALDGFDCVWVLFKGRGEAAPLENRALQWIDWKLQGQLSRFLVSDPEKKKGTTFIPTMKKLPASFLALDRDDDSDWDAFWRNCEGLKLKNVLFFCEDESMIPELEKHLKARRSGAYPERCAVGADEQ